MSGLLALMFLAAAVFSFVAYNGTPHNGTSPQCGPLDLFGQTFTVPFGCADFSKGEIILAIACLLMALLSAIAARPRRPVDDEL